MADLSKDEVITKTSQRQNRATQLKHDPSAWVVFPPKPVRRSLPCSDRNPCAALRGPRLSPNTTTAGTSTPLSVKTRSEPTSTTTVFTSPAPQSVQPGRL
ncbi:hypothetical protein RRF57_001442 [Xylaria bambusicola]|uniref:Uncharacterized protein n=1 Tax=Xylaria bambusicola TaxID=326684 RepID=A0AAN7UH99_9PEZI